VSNAPEVVREVGIHDFRMPRNSSSSTSTTACAQRGSRRFLVEGRRLRRSAPAPASLLSYRPDRARSRCPAVDKVFSHSTPPAFHFQTLVRSAVTAISPVLGRIQTIQMPRFLRASSWRRPGGGRDPSLPLHWPSPVWQNFCWQYWSAVECPKPTDEACEWL